MTVPPCIIGSPRTRLVTERRRQSTRSSAASTIARASMRAADTVGDAPLPNLHAEQPPVHRRRAEERERVRVPVETVTSGVRSPKTARPRFVERRLRSNRDRCAAAERRTTTHDEPASTPTSRSSSAAAIAPHHGPRAT